jgi:hypothetical protein
MAISTARIEHLAWRAANKPPGSMQGCTSELREAGLGMDFHDAVPGVPYPPVDLEDLGLQCERLAWNALACEAAAEGGR